MEPNKRSWKTRPVVKSGIFCNWGKKVLKMTTHTQTHVCTYIPHTVGQSWIHSHGMCRGLTEVCERVLVAALGKWLRTMQKGKLIITITY